MLFNSIEFLFLFLPICIVGFYAFSWRKPANARIFLLFSSFVFYGMWDWRYIILLLASVLFNYNLSTLLRKNKSGLLLVVGILTNIGSIIYFKYADFFLGTANSLGGDFELLHIVLPLGISFFTFQQVSFLVESYREEVDCKNFWGYALFITFFPQLIAGPVVRYCEVADQLNDHKFGIVNWNLISAGIFIFTIGLSKKVLLADEFAAIASPLFELVDNGESIGAAQAWLAVFSYSFQIYFDFSGYSDMAIGLGLMFGIRLPVNFLSPYKARNIIEFWRRWHMTLSRFLRDFLYFPLGGNRSGKIRRYFNLAIVMLLGGLWHGASWNFVIWGGLHGTYLVITHLFHKLVPPTEIFSIRASFFYGLITYLAICIAWVFFRSENIDSAFLMIEIMAGGGDIEYNFISNVWIFWENSPYLLLGTLIVWRCRNSISLLEQYELYLEGKATASPANANAVGVLLATSIFVIYSGAYSEFIYFQF